MGKLLVISLALNGYQYTYRKHLSTHKAYADRIGAQYLLVSKPFISKLGVECCWLKLHLARQALCQGFDNVLLLDADAAVSEQAPDIRDNLVAGKYVYMAKGYTNRYNSGVMLLANHSSTIDFLDCVIGNRLKPIPAEDSVGWGENGHIIYYAKQSGIVKELNCVWNNTYKKGIEDYIRHQNHGPFRTSAAKRMLHKVLAMLSRAFVRYTVSHPKLSANRIPSSWFYDEFENIVACYPLLQKKV